MRKGGERAEQGRGKRESAQARCLARENVNLFQRGISASDAIPRRSNKGEIGLKEEEEKLKNFGNR